MEESLKLRVNKIKDTVKVLDTINLELISIIYANEGLSVIPESLKHNHAYYNKENNVVIIDKEFTAPYRKRNELAYVLLHEFYHFKEQVSGALPRGNRDEEDADVYA